MTIWWKEIFVDCFHVVSVGSGIISYKIVCTFEKEWNTIRMWDLLDGCHIVVCHGTIFLYWNYVDVLMPSLNTEDELGHDTLWTWIHLLFIFHFIDLRLPMFTFMYRYLCFMCTYTFSCREIQLIVLLLFFFIFSLGGKKKSASVGTYAYGFL